MTHKKLIISILFFFISTITACSINSGTTGITNAETANNFPKNRNLKNMKECGRGYVVGVWINADGWDDWIVWLSKKGQNWANDDVKAYWAYSHSTTDYESGKAAYATILSAQATEQLVAVLDDASSACSDRNASSNDGPQFDSIQTWYP